LNRPLGCLTGAGLIAGLLTALTVGAAAALGGNALFSPGELNANPGQAPLGAIDSHAELSQDCGKCHAPFWGDERMGDRCLACHTQVADELAVVSGFHFGYASARNCRTCHTEHQGPAAALTLQEIVNYPHDRTGFTLLAHPPTSSGGAFRCMDCHPIRLRQFSTASCRGCHQLLDPDYTSQHLSDFGSGCLECHDGVDRYGIHFSHQQLALPLEGEHADLRCASCHPGARTVAALRQAPTRCFACHASDDIHSGRLGQACDDCHTPQTWQDAALDHAITGFPLLGSHAGADCLGCHVDRQWSGIPRTCAGCHSEQDPHRGQFVQDCDACHAPTRWSEIRFDHQQSDYPLVGAHRSAECADCHAEGRYVGTPTACYACHAGEDEHQGRFGQDCGACHKPTRWEDWTFDHDISRFRLTGAHRSTACLNCHQGGSFSGTPTACSACHAEPGLHRGVFGLQCGSCHNTSAWRPASWNGPHSFPLNHAGAGGSCSTCHPSSYGQYTCYGCHKHDPAKIEKKHREEGIPDFSDCVRCHPGGKKEDGGGDGGDDD
jgi:hypothetical protein